MHVVPLVPVAEPRLHPAVKEAAAALSRARVRWLLLWVPDGGLDNPKGDLDLLVDSADVPQMITSLERIGFVRFPRRGADLHLLRYDSTTDRWLWLHATTHIAFGPHRLHVRGARGCLARRWFDGVIPRPDDDVQFWALLWHCLAFKGRIASHHRNTLRTAIVGARIDGDGAACFSAACGSRETATRIVDAVVQEEWSAAESYAPICAAALRPSTRGALRLVAAARRRLSRAWHWRDERGLSVAILGPDGAGKSTLIEGLTAVMPFPTTVVYMGLTGGRLRHIRRLRIPGALFCATAIALWTRYLIARWHVMRGRLVLFDRYVYDAVAPPGYAQGALARTERRLCAYLCPSPDVIVLLDAPGAVMHARKGEYDPATLESWRSHFLTLRSRLGRLQIVDATAPAASVRADVTARIWASYSARWTRRHRRFTSHA
jgi:thymidylate kinase